MKKRKERIIVAKRDIPSKVMILSNVQMFTFRTVTEAAEFFKTDRVNIVNALYKGEKVNGFSFSFVSSEPETETKFEQKNQPIQQNDTMKNRNNSMEEILAQRAKTHGNFESGVSPLYRKIMKSINARAGKLNDAQYTALSMIAMKVARILDGDSNEIDHWQDICGYAMLVANSLKPRTTGNDIKKQDHNNEWLLAECTPILVDPRNERVSEHKTLITAMPFTWGVEI